MRTQMALEEPKSCLVTEPPPITPSWLPQPEAALRWKPRTCRAREKRFGNEGAV
jgi:hypothetical protein